MIIAAVSAISPYKTSEDASLDAKIMFGPEADGENIFAHIHEDITGDPKIVIDPESKFADSVKSGEDFDGSARSGGIKAEETLEDKIEVSCKLCGKKYYIEMMEGEKTIYYALIHSYDGLGATSDKAPL